jgi:hypothetical protein
MDAALSGWVNALTSLSPKRSWATWRQNLVNSVAVYASGWEIRYPYPIENGAWILQHFGHPAVFIRLKTNTKLRAYLACVQHDCGLALGIASGKSVVNIVVVRKRMGKCLRLCTSFADSKP